jgi:hypothetical protein
VITSVIGAYAMVIAVTAVFHLRYVRTQREFLIHPRPWLDFLIAAAGEWTVCGLVATYLLRRAGVVHEGEIVLISFASAMLIRYILRKELLLDVRGLRHEVRKDEMK